MEVTGFLCVSPGRNTVQVEDVRAYIQRLISVVKMATVLEECNTEEQRSVMRFLWTEGLNKRIHK
jgi:hypothetical protein